MPSKNKREAGAFNPAGLPAVGGFIGRARLCFGKPKLPCFAHRKENFSRWSQFLRHHSNVKNHDEYKGQAGGTSGKETDREAATGCQYETDRVAVLRHQKASREAGLCVSEYVRQAVVSAEVIPRLNRQDADTIRKLAGEANNINQLAHRANAGGFALVAVELVKLKNRIIEIINHLSDDWKNKKGKRI